MNYEYYSDIGELVVYLCVKPFESAYRHTTRLRREICLGVMRREPRRPAPLSQNNLGYAD